MAVVDLDEGVELGLQCGDGGGAGLAGEPFFESLVEALDFAAGGGVARGGVDLNDAEAVQFVLKVVAAAFAAGEAGGVRPCRCRSVLSREHPGWQRLCGTGLPRLFR